MDYDLLKEKLKEVYPSPSTDDVNWLQLSKHIQYSHTGIMRSFRNKSLQVDVFETLCTLTNYPPGYFFKENKAGAYASIDTNGPKLLAETSASTLVEMQSEILTILKKHFK